MPKGWDFKDKSKDIKKQMNVVSEEAMEAALLFIEAQAKSLSPVGNSGELRDKIDHQVESRGKDIIGKVGSPLEHALYVEFGTGEFAENGAGREKVDGRIRELRQVNGSLLGVKIHNRL